MKSDTKQSELKRNSKGHFAGGTPPAGFNAHPENRHNGAWKKEETARYKLEQMMKLSDAALLALMDDDDTPRFDKNMAKAIINGEWRELDSMINQVYGKPKESVDISNPDGTMTPIVRIIDDRRQTS